MNISEDFYVEEYKPADIDETIAIQNNGIDTDCYDYVETMELTELHCPHNSMYNELVEFIYYIVHNEEFINNMTDEIIFQIDSDYIYKYIYNPANDKTYIQFSYSIWQLDTHWHPVCFYIIINKQAPVFIINISSDETINIIINYNKCSELNKDNIKNILYDRLINATKEDSSYLENKEQMHISKTYNINWQFTTVLENICYLLSSDEQFIHLQEMKEQIMNMDVGIVNKFKNIKENDSLLIMMGCLNRWFAETNNMLEFQKFMRFPKIARYKDNYQRRSVLQISYYLKHMSNNDDVKAEYDMISDEFLEKYSNKIKNFHEKDFETIRRCLCGYVYARRNIYSSRLYNVIVGTWCMNYK